LEDSVGELQRSIQQLKIEKQQTEQQLAMLNMSTVKYQNAIAALSDLQAAGFNGNQIAELVGLVSIWNGIGRGAGMGTGLNVFGQGNGGGSSNSNRANSNKSRLNDKLITDKS
jgi:hypothetical protein